MCTFHDGNTISTTLNYILLENVGNVAINDVLPLKAARHCAIANIRFLGPRDTSNLISMVSFTLAMRRHLIQLASAPLTSFCLAKFDFLCISNISLSLPHISFSVDMIALHCDDEPNVTPNVNFM